jgi:hypothetical protein
MVFFRTRFSTNKPVIITLVVLIALTMGYPGIKHQVKADETTESLVYLPVSMKAFPNPPEFGAQISLQQSSSF